MATKQVFYVGKAEDPQVRKGYQVFFISSGTSCHVHATGPVSRRNARAYARFLNQLNRKFAEQLIGDLREPALIMMRFFQWRSFQRLPRS